MSPAILIATALFGLFGDHDPGVPLITSLADRNCASALDLGNPVALAYAGKENDIKASLDPAATCVKTAAGPALYRMFQLPETDAPYVITVTSKPFGGAILPPRVLLLAHTGAVKRELAGADLTFHGDGLTARFRSHPDESYLVVESDSALIGSSVSRVAETTSSYIMPAGNGYFTIYTGNDQTTQFVYSHTGNLKIVLEPLPKPN